MGYLKAPEGTNEVSFSGERFTVGLGGLVCVPDGAHLHLHQFGFVNPSADEIEAAKAEEAKAAETGKAEEAKGKKK